MNSDLDPRQDMQPHMPRVLNRQVFYKGQTIIEQDTEGHRAFYIEKGEVEVVVRDGPYEVRVATLGEGELFGEMGLIEHEVRSAAVRALHDTTVAVISERELENKFSMIDDRTVLALIHVLIRRLRDSNKGQVQQYRNLVEFQDRISGMLEKASGVIDERNRREFRKEVTPLLDQLDDLLDNYRAPNKKPR